MVVAHLTDNTRALLACSLTCHSWYIAVVPHLHHTLDTSTWYMYTHAKFEWPKPLRNAHRLGLLPLVKKLQIHRRDPRYFSGFSPKKFNCWTLHNFLALTNVRELGIDHLDIPSFMSSIQLYFGHFLPTLRSLALGEPKGSRRQIIYFVGLFRHLEDLKILYDTVDPQKEPEDDVTLIPPFVPPLGGRLTMCSTGVGLLTDMIGLFGGIRFRYLDIFNVGGTRLLLGACAETLETLRLYPTDPRGKEHSQGNAWVPADNFTASCLSDFGLFRNKSLRTLEFRVRHLDGAIRARGEDVAATLLASALSTIRSPLFSKVVVFYRDFDFRGVAPLWLDSPTRWLSVDEVAREARQHAKRFQAFRGLRGSQDFQLVLCVDVWEGAGDYALRLLEEAVAEERAKKRFNMFFPEPLVIYRPRRSRQNPVEYWVSDPWVPL